MVTLVGIVMMASTKSLRAEGAYPGINCLVYEAALCLAHWTRADLVRGQYQQFKRWNEAWWPSAIKRAPTDVYSTIYTRLSLEQV